MRISNVLQFLQQVKVLSQDPTTVAALDALAALEVSGLPHAGSAVEAAAAFYASATAHTLQELSEIMSVLAECTDDGGYLCYLHSDIDTHIAQATAHWA